MKRSRLAGLLTCLYLVWAAFWMFQILHDGLECSIPGGAIISICPDVIGFVLATAPALTLAVWVGLQPNYDSLWHLIIYIGLSAFLFYEFGLLLECLGRWILNQIQHRRK